jgi:hypothetical protein
MSVAGLSSSSLYQNLLQSNSQQQSEFQQLGQALQAGDLADAQEDYATIVQNQTQATSGTTETAASTGQLANNSPLVQAFNTLDQDIQSGDMTDAEQAFISIAQNLQPAQNQTQSQTNPITQAFNDLGAAVQSGNLSAAQQAFSLLNQTFTTLGQAFESGSVTQAQQALSALQQALQQDGLNTSSASAATSNTGASTNTTTSNTGLNVTA